MNNYGNSDWNIIEELKSNDNPKKLLSWQGKLD